MSLHPLEVRFWQKGEDQWAALGLTTEIARHSYNRYLAVAGRVVRRSLKDDKRLVAERRGQMELRFFKWEVSCATAAPTRNDTETGH